MVIFCTVSISQLTKANLENAARQWLSLVKPTTTKYGSDEKQLRKDFDKETVKNIIEKRKREGYYEEQDKTIVFNVISTNYKAFCFFFYHCHNLFRIGSMGGYFGFDWQQIESKARCLKTKLKPKHYIQLEIIENIVIDGLNKSNIPHKSKKR